MPQYYCDYCDKSLTYDSPSMRQTHSISSEHINSVKLCYQRWQHLVDVSTAEYRAGKIKQNSYAGGPQTKPQSVAIPPPNMNMGAPSLPGFMLGPHRVMSPFVMGQPPPPVMGQPPPPVIGQPPPPVMGQPPPPVMGQPPRPVMGQPPPPVMGQPPPPVMGQPPPPVMGQPPPPVMGQPPPPVMGQPPPPVMGQPPPPVMGQPPPRKMGQLPPLGEMATVRPPTTKSTT